MFFLPALDVFEVIGKLVRKRANVELVGVTFFTSTLNFIIYIRCLNVF